MKALVSVLLMLAWVIALAALIPVAFGWRGGTDALMGLSKLIAVGALKLCRGGERVCLEDLEGPL